MFQKTKYQWKNLTSTHLKCVQLEIHTLTTLHCEQHTVKRTLGLQHNVTHNKVKKKKKSAQTEQANAEGQLPNMHCETCQIKKIKHQKYRNHNQTLKKLKTTSSNISLSSETIYTALILKLINHFRDERKDCFRARHLGADNCEENVT